MNKVQSQHNPILTLEYLTSAHENKYFDRKSAKIRPADLADLISAFANAEGGTVVIGISDKRMELEGINAVGEDKINSFINAPKDCCKPMPDFDVEFLDVTNAEGKPDRILLLHIHSDADRIIRTSNDSTFLRIGDKTREMKGDDLRNLEYSKNLRHYEEECSTYAQISDLDEELIEDYKRRIGAEDLPTYQVLKARGFIREHGGEEKLTNAAVLLFAKNVRQFFQHCRIRFIRYDGVSAKVGTQMNIIKDITIEEPLVKMIEKAKQVVSLMLREYTALDPKTGTFKTRPEYPEFAWVEGIVNAVTHRDYSITGDYIRITMFDDRLEIFSPGKLPNIVTLDNIMETRFARNQMISRVLTEFGLVRELNEGVKRIYAEMKEQNLEPPIYTEKPYSVLLILKNKIEQSVNTAAADAITAKSGGNTGGNVGGNRQAIISEMKKNAKITVKQISSNTGLPVRTVEREIKAMKDAGIVQRKGSTRGEWIVL